MSSRRVFQSYCRAREPSKPRIMVNWTVTLSLGPAMFLAFLLCFSAFFSHFATLFPHLYVPKIAQKQKKGSKNSRMHLGMSKLSNMKWWGDLRLYATMTGLIVVYRVSEINFLIERGLEKTWTKMARWGLVHPEKFFFSFIWWAQKGSVGVQDV